LKQSCPPTPGQNKKEPFHIPLLYKLIQTDSPHSEQLLELKEEAQTLKISGLNKKPVLSINRNFSAPIVLDFSQSESDLLALLKHDDDAFNRWEAAQKMFSQAILKGETIDTELIETLRAILNDAQLDPAFKDLIFTLPAETYLHEQVSVIDPQAIHQSRRKVRAQLAQALSIDWLKTYQANATPGNYKPDALSAGKRSLKNLALTMLMEAKEASAHQLALSQYQQANNMTDRYGALSAMVQFQSPDAPCCLTHFHEHFKNDALVIDKWFTLQATRQPDLSDPSEILGDVQRLREHPDFQIKNPNRARSLIHAFCMSNPGAFHQNNGQAYHFWAKQVIELNDINPQVAARLARALDRWKQFAPSYQAQMKSALELISQHKNLSSDVAEVVNKALNS
jgi:aminopeptidase N